MTQAPESVQGAQRPLPRRGTGRPVPVILLGGGANAVSVARNLGRLGVPVYALNEPDALVNSSRYVRRARPSSSPEGEGAEAWLRFLLGPESSHLRDAVVLTCCDEGLALIARHRDALAARYLLDESDPEAQLRMLGKLETYEAALAAGVPTPRFALMSTREDVESLGDSWEYPLIVKPRLSHVFEARTGRKLLVVRDREGLASAVAAVQATGTEGLVMEMVPGPDDLLCSYYTYLDASSRPLFHFTKRIIRRYPALSGPACYHVTDWVPEAAELGARLFRHVGLRGLANVEFKRDVRDGKLKLIECNARFTASDCLVTTSGVNLAAFVYNRLTGDPSPPPTDFRRGVRLWEPARDFLAYRQQRRDGGPGLAAWLSSVLRPQTFPYFAWTDPGPALARVASFVARGFRPSG